jgi:hypothetical protein
MATLTSTKIKNTYDALLKASDNDSIGSSAKQITDGLGNGTPLYISTTQIGIGVTPEASYDLHVYSNAKVGGNLTVTGDLTVEGTTTTIDTQTLTVEDPLIEVASNNTSTDAVDIGWYGKYAPSGTTLYAGLFRDTGDSKFKLFRNLEEQPTTTVNTSGTGYTVATLVADVEGTLTGTIASSTVATTQSAGDNSTKVATTAYVDTTAGNYLPLAGGTMSGSIAMGSNNISGGGTFTATTFSGQLDGTISSTTTATTQTQGDNSTKVATTAYVDLAIGGQDTLAEILANGNTTGGTDIAVSSGDDITFTSTSKAIFNSALEIYHDATNNVINGTSGNFYVSSAASLFFRTSLNQTALTLDTSQNGTLVGNLTVSGTGQSSFGGQVTIPATPVASTDAASKGYVDSQVGANNELSEVLANGNTTGGTNISVSAGDDIDFTDTSEARFGSDQDLIVKHNGLFGVIQNKTGDIYIENTADNSDIIFKSDDGSGGTANYITIDGSDVITKIHKNFRYLDNVKANFGNGDDLQIYHDGSNSYVREGGTGDLLVRGNNLKLQTYGGADYLTASNGAQVELYYNNSKKFETTNTGISVTGGASFTDNIDINGNNKHIRFIDTYGNWQIEAGDGANNFKIHSQSLGADYLTLEGGGQLNLGEYGSGSFTGTATYRLAVDSSGDVIEIPIGDGAVDGSGAAGQVAFWTDTDTIDGENNLYWDSTNDRLGIGTSSPLTALDVISTDPNNNVSRIVNIRDDRSYAANVGGGISLFGKYNSGGSYSTFAQIIGAKTNATDNDYSGYLSFKTRPNNALPIERMRIDSSGNLLLKGGYISLNTNDDSRISGDSDSIDFILWDNSSSYQTRMTILDTGNVGIGTTTPTAPLHIEGATNSEVLKVEADADPYIRWVENGTNVGFLQFTGGTAYLSNMANGSFQFRTNNTTKMLITSSGNVGIGTTSPSEKLEINPNDGGDTRNIKTFFNTSSVYNPASEGTEEKVVSGLKFGWYSDYYQIGATRGGGTDVADFVISDTGQERLIIKANGNVGINVTSPSAGLQIALGGTTIPSAGSNTGSVCFGNTTSGNAYGLVMGANSSGVGYISSQRTDGTATTYNLAIQPNGGNVGIGTTSPDNKLHIKGGSVTRLKIESSGSNTGVLLTENGSDKWSVASVSGGSFQLYSEAASTTRFAIDTSGNVGIGTNSPNQALDVAGIGQFAGAIRITEAGTSQNILIGNQDSGGTNTPAMINGVNGELRFGRGNSWSGEGGTFTEVMRVSTNNNVGIGTTSPSHKLQIDDGSMLIEKNQQSGGTDHNFIQLVYNGGWSGNQGGLAAINVTDGYTSTNTVGKFGVTYGGGGGRFVVTDLYDGGYGASGDVFYVRGDGRAYIQTRLGIGTIPDKALHVSGDSLMYGNLFLDGSSNSFRAIAMNTTDGNDNESLYLCGGGTASAARGALVGALGNEFSARGGELVLQGGRVSTGHIILSTGTATTERMRIDSSGNIGIGDTSPDYKLTVAKTSQAAPAFMVSGAYYGGPRIQTYGLDADSNAWMGLGTDMSGAAYEHNIYFSDYNNNGRLSIGTYNGTTYSEKMCVLRTGNVGINDNSPDTAALEVVNIASDEYTGSFDYENTDGTVGALKVRLSGGSTSPSLVDFIYGTSLVGAITTTGSGTIYLTSSDYRLKENVVELTGALDRVSQLQPKRFNFISTPEDTVDGFLAHEVSDIVPEAIRGTRDEVDAEGNPVYQGIDQSKLVPLLVGAIQELKAEIETLKAQINN